MAKKETVKKKTASKRRPADKTPVYNEPLPKVRGDYIPRMPKVKLSKVSATVKARLEVESALDVCGNADSRRTFQYTAIRRKALLAILAESDSPLSASLRAAAASAVGGIKDRRIKAAVRKIALDESEDLETRLGAVASLIHVSGKEATKDIDTILASKNFQVRRTAYLAALRSPVREIVAIAEKRFKRQKNPRLRNIVSRRIPSFQTDSTIPAE